MSWIWPSHPLQLQQWGSSLSIGIARLEATETVEKLPGEFCRPCTGALQIMRRPIAKAGRLESFALPSDAMTLFPAKCAN